MVSAKKSYTSSIAEVANFLSENTHTHTHDGAYLLEEDCKFAVPGQVHLLQADDGLVLHVIPQNVGDALLSQKKEQSKNKTKSAAN